MNTSATILIVDDDPVFRRVISLTVAKAGLNVESATDGQAGWERVQQGGIDILVTDYQMPVCSGLELLQRVNELPAERRPDAILCTARGLEMDRDNLLKQFHLIDVMHKPFSPQRLNERLLSRLRDRDRATEPPHCAASCLHHGAATRAATAATPASHV